MYNNEKGQSLDKHESKDEGEDIGYVIFLFVTLLSSFQKESNHPINMGKGTKNLNYLIFILKIG